MLDGLSRQISTSFEEPWEKEKKLSLPYKFDKNIGGGMLNKQLNFKKRFFFTNLILEFVFL